MTTIASTRRTIRRDEAATSLGVSTKTIDRWVKQGRLQGFLQGRVRLIVATSVDAYIARKLEEAQADAA